MTAFVLQWQSWVVVTEPLWCAKPNITSYLYRKGLLIPDLKQRLPCFSLTLWGSIPIMGNLLIPKPTAIPVCSSSAGSHFSLICSLGPSVLAQMVKNLPAMQDTRVQSLGREDPLEKGMATHFSIHWLAFWAVVTGNVSSPSSKIQVQTTWCVPTGYILPRFDNQDILSLSRPNQIRR